MCNLIQISSIPVLQVTVATQVSICPCICLMCFFSLFIHLNFVHLLYLSLSQKKKSTERNIELRPIICMLKYLQIKCTDACSLLFKFFKNLLFCILFCVE